jgi:ligand-binding SRPBCC domain-containing protein
MFHIRSENCSVRSFDLVSHLAADRNAVWRRIASVEGINAELWPIRMHLPRELDVLQAAAAEGRSRGVLISLAGLVPLDWHWLGLESATPGEGFYERSSSMWMREWVHVRTIRPEGTGCTLHDHVELTPRLGSLAPLLAPLYRAVFRRRHRELLRQFGEQR